MITYQSKYGYHPCDYETFLKLKEAHLLFLRAYRDIRAYERWERKRNAEGEAPKHPSFVANYGWFYRSHKARKEGRVFYGWTVDCGKVQLGWANIELQFYEQLLEQHRNARTPKATAEEVTPLELPDNFWEIVEKLKGFYDVNRKDVQSGVDAA